MKEKKSKNNLKIGKVRVSPSFMQSLHDSKGKKKIEVLLKEVFRHGFLEGKNSKE